MISSYNRSGIGDGETAAKKSGGGEIVAKLTTKTTGTGNYTGESLLSAEDSCSTLKSPGSFRNPFSPVKTTHPHCLPSVQKPSTMNNFLDLEHLDKSFTNHINELWQSGSEVVLPFCFL